jgi:glycosyltransferase involved in cell wall biosynthesis
VPELIRLVARERPAAVYASSPPEDIALLAHAVSRECDLPLVLDFRDQWSYQSSAPYRHFVDFLLERRLEKRVLAESDQVIVTTRAAAELLVRVLGVPSSKVTVLPNGYDERDFPDGATSEPLAEGKFNIVYAGELTVREVEKRGGARFAKSLGFGYHPLGVDTRGRSPDALLEALERLLDRRPQLQDRIVLWLVGTDPRMPSSRMRGFRYHSVLRVLPRVPAAEAVRMTRGAQLLVLLQNLYFLNGKPFCVAIPGKLYSYLRTGQRILASVQSSEISETIERLGAGTTVPPMDVVGLETALECEVERWQRGGQSATLQRDISQFDRRHLSGVLANLVRSVVPDAAVESRVTRTGRSGTVVHANR